jgi:hypothetical protein
MESDVEDRKCFMFLATQKPADAAYFNGFYKGIKNYVTGIFTS